MNDKQVRYLIHCIARSFGGTPAQTEKVEYEINKTFDELGDSE